MAAPILMGMAHAGAGFAGTLAGAKLAEMAEKRRKKAAAPPPPPPPQPAAKKAEAPAPTPAPAPAPKSATRKAFEKEFAAARERGDVVFTFRGKEYSTREEGEKGESHREKMMDRAAHRQMVENIERSRKQD